MHKKLERASNWMYIEDRSKVGYLYINKIWKQEQIKYFATIWLVFKTQEDAELWWKRQNALLSIRKRKTENDWDFIPDWSDNTYKYFVYLAYDDTLRISDETFAKIQPLIPCYSSKEIAERVIKELEKEYKILFDKNKNGSQRN